MTKEIFMVAQPVSASDPGFDLTEYAIQRFDQRGGRAYNRGCAAVEWSGPDHVVHALQRHIDLQNIDRSLDLGAGTGGFGKAVKAINPRIHVVGVEPAQSMIETGVEDGYIDTPIVARIRDPGWRCHPKFKVVASVGVLDFLHDPAEVDALADGIAEELARDGVFGITFEPTGTPHPGSNNAQFASDYLRDLFAARGLGVLSEESIYLYKSFDNRKENQLLGREQPAVENVVMIGGWAPA